MKAFISLTLLICLAFVSFGQVASGPPVDTETITMESQESQIIDASADVYIVPAVISRTLELRSDRDEKTITRTADLSVSGSPISTGGTLSLKLDNGTIVYSNGKVLQSVPSKKFTNPNLPYAYAYQWNPGYVGWQR